MNEVRKQCKVCNSSNVEESSMREEGEEIPVTVCQEEDCGWWG